MRVNGSVKISLSLNVYDCETDNVYVDKYGNVRISDDEAFFVDWSDHWEQGIGELLGASVLSEDLEIEPDDDLGDDDDEEKGW